MLMQNTSSPTPAAAGYPDGLPGLVDAVQHKNPMHRKFMAGALAQMTVDETQRLEQYIAYCQQRGLTIDYLSDCYLTIVGDTLREQIYFQKHRQYRYSTFAEVGASVYFNDEYMSFYMYGLALTAFLWPNHLAMLRFFRDNLPKNSGGKYLEVGPGHGYYLMTAMEYAGYDSFTGIDISETSIAQTRALIQHFGGGRHAERFDLQCMDFLACTLPADSFDAVVMGEVLEHVEQPQLFLKQAARIARKDAYIYITSCLNAPAVDHIFLFRDTAQLEKLFDDCGLRIRQQLVCPYQGTTLQESMESLLAVNVAYVLEKK
ncbi:MAG: class I SAM-dependent methyltransferase [Micavibrio sp.]|nr:class I SAM-dependent methyltransferase [Micavibrio sp.]